MPLTNVTFKVVGKVFDPLRRGEKLKAALLGTGTVRRGLLAKIEAVHCTVHDQDAKAVLKATFNYEIQGCCVELIEEVKRLLGP